MKLFKKKPAKKTKKQENLIIKSGKNDIRVYPKGSLLVTELKHEK